MCERVRTIDAQNILSGAGGQVECIKKEWQYTLDVYIYVELIDLCYF